MKRIRTLPGPTPGLEAYRAKAGGQESWEEFRSFRGSTDSYWELAAALETRQHGLCGYCEVALSRPNRQVEHIKPQSSHAEAALDYANLIACCAGARSPPGTDGDEGGRRRRGRNVSCGSAKGNAPPEDILDPRQLPASPSVFRVFDDGRIEADSTACETVGLEASKVERTIGVLRLNVPRLRRAREHRWNALRDSMKWFAEAEQVRASAALELLPNQDDLLIQYFTTARCFFESRIDVVDDILDRTPQPWI